LDKKSQSGNNYLKPANSTALNYYCATLLAQQYLFIGTTVPPIWHGYANELTMMV